MFWNCVMCSQKNLGKFIMNYWLFYANCDRPLKKFLYPLSGIREKDIPDRSSRTQKCSGSRIPDPDPQNSLQYLTLYDITLIHVKALPEMENRDESVFGRTDDGPLSQSCPVCSCKKKMHLYLFSYGILQFIFLTIWHLLG